MPPVRGEEIVAIAGLGLELTVVSPWRRAVAPAAVVGAVFNALWSKYICLPRGEGTLTICSCRVPQVLKLHQISLFLKRKIQVSQKERPFYCILVWRLHSLGKKKKKNPKHRTADLEGRREPTSRHRWKEGTSGSSWDREPRAVKNLDFVFLKVIP